MCSSDLTCAHLSHFQFSATMDISAMNTLIPLWTYVLISLGCIHRSGITRSLIVYTFSFSRYCQMVFQSGRTTAHVLTLVNTIAL